MAKDCGLKMLSLDNLFLIRSKIFNRPGKLGSCPGGKLGLCPGGKFGL